MEKAEEIQDINGFIFIGYLMNKMRPWKSASFIVRWITEDKLFKMFSKICNANSILTEKDQRELKTILLYLVYCDCSHSQISFSSQGCPCVIKHFPNISNPVFT